MRPFAVSRVLALAAVLLAVPQSVHAVQGPPSYPPPRGYGRAPTPGDSFPGSIAEAEAQGARRERTARNNPGDGRLYGGTAERRCVSVDSINVARSGDFLAGPFTHGDPQALGRKIWWEPAYVSPTTPASLTVSAVRIDTVGAARVYVGFTLSRASNPETRVRSATQFYPGGIRFPSRGRWMLVATAGPNWGCYTLEVG
jgi:hypothetical protein